MKVLLKKEICGSRKQCTGPTENTPQPQNAHLKNKNKKKKKTQMQDTAFSSVPKRVVILECGHLPKKRWICRGEYNF